MIKIVIREQLEPNASTRAYPKGEPGMTVNNYCGWVCICSLSIYFLLSFIFISHHPSQPLLFYLINHEHKEESNMKEDVLLYIIFFISDCQKGSILLNPIS